MTIDVDRLAAILANAADAEILPRFRKLGEDDVRTKSSAIDLVTEADEAAERFIKAECAKLWPEALFIGEESVAADKALLPQLAGADLAIVVDPIDGTANFAAGLPLFAVMAAVVSGGETVAGLIYDPLGRDLMVAEKGKGAVLDRRGERQRLRVSPAVPVEEMIGTGSTTYLPREQKAELLARVAAIRVFGNYRCAGHEYWQLASGHSQFAFFTGKEASIGTEGGAGEYHGEIMPWDHLAGALIVTEAGGYVRRLDGSDYRPEHVDGGLLASVDEASWQAVAETLFRAR